MTSDVYPSRAADYGASQLMAMAGSLAERADSDIADDPIRKGTDYDHDLAVTTVRGQVANAYATLALAAAIRELPESIAPMLAELPGELAFALAKAL